jgi:Cof subfamily protein (haloacid dehalogenase superfamily)
MEQRIVFLDIDGTIITKDNKIHPSTVSACREARKNGHLLFLCSGRPSPEIIDTIRDIGFDGVVSAGGAHIEVGGRIIFCAFIPQETLRHILDYLKARKMLFLLETNEKIIPGPSLLNYLDDLPEVDPLWLSILKETEKEGCNLDRDDVNKVVFAQGKDVLFMDLKREFGTQCEIFRGSIPYLGKECGEIGPIGVHKGSAMKTVIDYYGIPRENTIAIGDSDNDRRMIEYAAFGIAMGNADDEIKQIADDVTGSVENGGIAQAFRKYGLI